MIEFAETSIAEDVIPLSLDLLPKTNIGLIIEGDFDDFVSGLHALNMDTDFSDKTPETRRITAFFRLLVFVCRIIGH